MRHIWTPPTSQTENPKSTCLLLSGYRFGYDHLILIKVYFIVSFLKIQIFLFTT